MVMLFKFSKRNIHVIKTIFLFYVIYALNKISQSTVKNMERKKIHEVNKNNKRFIFFLIKTSPWSTPIIVTHQWSNNIK